MKKLLASVLVGGILLIGCSIIQKPSPAPVHNGPPMPPMAKALVAPQVVAAPRPNVVGSPNITLGLTNVILVPGNGFLFAIGASGNAPLSYQWTFNNKVIVGANINTYLGLNFTNSGTISVTVANGVGSISTSAYVAVGDTTILSNCLQGPTNITAVWCPASNGVPSHYNLYAGVGFAPGWSGDVPNPTNQCNPPLIPGTNFFRHYTTNWNVGNVTTTVVSNVIRGVTNFFAVTWSDTNGLESPFSNEAMVSPPAFPPLTNFSTRILMVSQNTALLSAKVCAQSKVTVLYKKSLTQGSWTPLASGLSPDIYGNFFYYDPVDKSGNRLYQLQLQ